MNKKALITSIIITILYALLTLNTVLHHEVWADEAQVWQLCKHLSIPELFNHLKNEGHPILFYLLVMPFAKLFPDIIFMKLICWFFMSASVFLLTYFSPFKIYTNLAIILSAGFIYFFPVLARNYSIIPFLVFLAAILYNKQKEHPVIYATNIALLTNTHIIMSFFSLCLATQFFYENFILNFKEKNYAKIKQYILPIGIIIVGFLATILILFHTTSSNSLISLNTNDLLTTTNRVLSLFFLNSINYNLDYYKITPTNIIELIGFSGIIISYILLFISLFKESKKFFLIAISSIGFQLCIYIFAYNTHIYTNRIFCAHIILLFCLWILMQKNKSKIATKTNILLTILFITTIFNGFKYTILDLQHEYSGSRETAEFIQKNINSKNSIILTDIDSFSIATAYYLKGKYNLYSIKRNQKLKYVIWDKNITSFFPNNSWLEKSREYQKTNDVYILLPYFATENQLDKIFPDKFMLIYESKINIEKREGHRIYKFIEK